LPASHEAALIDGVTALLDRQERQWEHSKAEAISALVEAFSGKVKRLTEELSAREAEIRNLTEYFERRVLELSDRASRDPKTRLTNFTRFLEQLETYLAVEQRGRWCAVGIVDITEFKGYNDTLGHPAGDRVIERVARLLQEHVRAADLLARDVGQELHARFGGDEFCFLVPDLDGPADAQAIANRFRNAVGHYDWSLEDPRLADRPVTVDVGVACLLMDSMRGARRRQPDLGRQLLAHADRMMYAAKTARASQAHAIALRISEEGLVPVDQA
jgi:diguanylate cyclase (GGDEF)-like protein